MSKSILTATLATLIGLAFIPTGSSLAANAEVPDALKTLAPDVSQWQALSEGYYSGRGDNGEVVSAYLGESGKRIALHELRKALQAAEGRAVLAPHDKAQEAQHSVEALRRQIAEIEALPSTEGDEKLVFTQNVETSSGLFCTQEFLLKSSFTARLAIVDTPRVSASLNWLNFGPGGVLPFSVYRSVTATVESISAQDSAGNHWEDVSASAVTMTFGGSCSYTTHHFLQVQCTDAHKPRFLSLTRSQTCANVLNGVPPSNSVDDGSELTQ